MKLCTRTETTAAAARSVVDPASLARARTHSLENAIP